MNVLSLFDGMSCGRIALGRAGIKVDNYFASEIDKHAIKVSRANYPDIKHIGCVTDVLNLELPKIDLLIGGSPCQGFSFAGKQLNFDDPRSKLFFEFVKIKNKINPQWFLLENVKMKKEYQDIISEHLRVEPIEINSSLVSAQNRKRLYWTNIPNADQPDDKGIILADIIETGVVDRDKSYCIDANYHKGTNLNQYINKCRRQLVFMLQKPRGKNQGGVKALDGKTPCLSANSWEHNNHLAYAFTERRTEEAKRIRKEFREKFGKDFSPRRAKELVPRTDGKMNCLTATYSLKEHTLIDEKLYYRKLTPIECERLQTVPDIEKRATIKICSDQAKSFVNAVNLNPKLQKLVLSVGALKLIEYVDRAISNTLQNPQPIKNTVLQNADTPTRKQTSQCTKQNPNDQFSNASNAEKKTTSHYQNAEVGFATLTVFINLTEGLITHCGLGELPQKEKNYIHRANGRIQSKSFGVEIMQLANDVAKSLSIKKTSNSTLNPLSVSNLEQTLIISYYYAKLVTDGYIQKRTIEINLSLVDGYTNHVSNTQRYKMLGNGWTVDVISHIFKQLQHQVTFI